MIKRNIGENIKKYRTLRGISQDELAIELGVTRQSVSSWEVNRTEPRMGAIERMASIFGCTKSDLLYGSGQDESYYLYREAAELAEFLKSNPQYKVLFDASKRVKPEDILKVKAMIDLMSDK